MKKAAKVLLTALGITVSAGFLTRLWLTRPEIFPAFPEPFAEYLVKLYGAQNAEQVSDLELLIGLTLSLITISALFLLAACIWRRVKKTRKNLLS